MRSNLIVASLAGCAAVSKGQTQSQTFSIQLSSAPPKGATTISDSTPIGVSIEFFAWPEYITKVSGTQNCLSALGKTVGKAPPIRIGGTTQDRALYDPLLKSAVAYSVPDSTQAPAILTYGPSFLDLAGKYSGQVTIGVNRQKNNMSNTILATQQAEQRMRNLFAVELGNEPDYYVQSSPIAQGKKWDPTADAQSELLWQSGVASKLVNKTIVQAGVRLGWSDSSLVPFETSSPSNKFVKSYSRHSYPQSACGGAKTDLSSLMSHSSIVQYTAKYKDDASSVRNSGKEYYFAETNSATCGGGGISPTFGAALWIVDYTMQSLLNGVQRLYFHQGTIDNCAYCWWSRTTTLAPYYGAQFVSQALSSITSISMIDSGSTAYAMYTLYSSSRLSKVLLYNSDLYSGTGTRSSHTFTFTVPAGYTKSTVSLRRLTSSSANNRVETGGVVTIDGQTYSNANCGVVGKATGEMAVVGKNGVVTVVVRASEAVIVYF